MEIDPAAIAAAVEHANCVRMAQNVPAGTSLRQELRSRSAQAVELDFRRVVRARWQILGRKDRLFKKALA
jgi:hypothetical protein